MDFIDTMPFCSLLHLITRCLEEVNQNLQFCPLVVAIDIDERFDCYVKVFITVLLVHISALRYDRLEFFEELAVCFTVNWWYFTVVIKGKLRIWYFCKDVHDELKACLFEIFLSFRIKMLNRLDEVPFKYLIIGLKKYEALVSVYWSLYQLLLHVHN